MKVVAIIQARMRSTRLPGKIMEKLQGRTVLAHDIERIGATSRVDEVVVATSDLAVDDAVAAEAARAGAKVSRGSEDDVLSRYYHAAEEHQADIIVRMTSDCPLFDPVLLDKMLAEFLASFDGDHSYDYYSNTLRRRTYPTGLDAEIFTRAALNRAHHEGHRPPEREHVTPYLHQNPDLFHLGGMEAEVDHSALRWTLDTPADLELITRIYDSIYRPDRLFTTEDVLRLVAEQPDILAINNHILAKTIEPTPEAGLLIRADASAEIGAGHVMRCLALAQAWPTEAGPVTFIMAEGTEIFGHRLRAEGFSVELISAVVGSPDDLAQTTAIAERHPAAWLVMDGYRFDKAYVADLSAGNNKTLLLDDSGQDGLPPVDIVLNQNLHADMSLYPGRSSNTEFMLGSPFVLLRQEFLANSGVKSEVPAVVKHLLITLGGGDPENIAGRVLAALASAARPDLQLRVLVGANRPHRQVLERQVQESPLQVELVAMVEDMVPQYQWADLAVTGGGSTLWELAYFGLPALTFVLVPNQEPSSRILAQRGVTRCLGRLAQMSEAEHGVAIRDLMDSPTSRAAMAAAGRDLIDGQGAQRVVKMMRQMCSAEATP